MNERMATPSLSATRQSIPTIPAATQRLIDLFDAAAGQGYSHITLFERTSPGARDALFTWATLHGYSIRERTISTPGQSQILLTACDVVVNGALGPSIAIQAEVVS
jgi:hypothetical protein